jgi:glycosyltransferase involved in cell wall biosynthesis
VSALHVGLFTECYLPIQNGVTASVEALARELRAGGHEVTCVTPRMPHYREVQEFVVRVPSLPLPTRTAYRLTIPFISGERTLRAFDRLSIVHAHSAFVTGWMGLRLARRLRVPLVFTYHTQLEEYAHYVPFDVRATRNAASTLTRVYANAADAVVVPTAAMEQHLRAIRVSAPICVAPSGIDVARFAGGRRDEELRARLGVAPDQKLVLSVGRLGREKNVELTIDAFARVGDPGARLVFVGDGPQREALERYAERAGVARRTTFAREFARAALPDVYRSADAFAFSSTSETQGLVLIEALAAGLPVVAVDTPQTRDVLGGAGTVTAPDPAAFASALRASLAAPAKRPVPPHVVQRFEEGATARRIVGLYRELIAADRVPRAG